MNPIRIWKYTWIILFISIVCLSLSGCYGTKEGGAVNVNEVIPAVEALQARQGSLPLTERLTGVVKAGNQVAIYPEINAVITEVLVKNGQVVERGQPLVRLRDKEFREQMKQLQAAYQMSLAQARQAEAQLKEAQAGRRRAESMAEQKLISEADLDTARTRAESAEAALDLANARVEQSKANLNEQEEVITQTVVRAPVSGTVGDRNAEVGMLVGSGTQLFKLGQLDSVRVEVVLTDRMLEYIKPGHRVEILAGGSSPDPMQASLSRISPFLNPVSHTTVGEIDVANRDRRLRPGMFVSVDVYHGESEQATLVPLSALYENPVTGGTGVYVSKNPLGGDLSQEQLSGRSQRLTDPVEFEFVPVVILAKGRLHAGISGIEPGQWVVTIGQDLLGGQTGKARVRIVEWDWVEQLQQLQRQELLEEVMKRQQSEQADASSNTVQGQTSE